MSSSMSMFTRVQKKYTLTDNQMMDMKLLRDLAGLRNDADIEMDALIQLLDNREPEGELLEPSPVEEEPRPLRMASEFPDRRRGREVERREVERREERRDERREERRPPPPAFEDRLCVYEREDRRGRRQPAGHAIQPYEPRNESRPLTLEGIVSIDRGVKTHWKFSQHHGRPMPSHDCGQVPHQKWMARLEENHGYMRQNPEDQNIIKAFMKKEVEIASLQGVKKHLNEVVAEMEKDKNNAVIEKEQMTKQIRGLEHDLKIEKKESQEFADRKEHYKGLLNDTEKELKSSEKELESFKEWEQAINDKNYPQLIKDYNSLVKELSDLRKAHANLQVKLDRTESTLDRLKRDPDARARKPSESPVRPQARSRSRSPRRSRPEPVREASSESSSSSSSSSSSESKKSKVGTAFRTGTSHEEPLAASPPKPRARAATPPKKRARTATPRDESPAPSPLSTAASPVPSPRAEPLFPTSDGEEEQPEPCSPKVSDKFSLLGKQKMLPWVADDKHSYYDMGVSKVRMIIRTEFAILAEETGSKICTLLGDDSLNTILEIKDLAHIDNLDSMKVQMHRKDIDVEEKVAILNEYIATCIEAIRKYLHRDFVGDENQLLGVSLFTAKNMVANAKIRLPLATFVSEQLCCKLEVEKHAKKERVGCYKFKGPFGATVACGLILSQIDEPLRSLIHNDNYKKVKVSSSPIKLDLTVEKGAQLYEEFKKNSF